MDVGHIIITNAQRFVSRVDGKSSSIGGGNVDGTMNQSSRTRPIVQLCSIAYTQNSYCGIFPGMTHT